MKSKRNFDTGNKVVELFSVFSETKLINDEFLVVYSVLDIDGCPINYGHFADETDALYVKQEMITGKYFGDSVSDLCLACTSCFSGMA